MKSKFKFVWIIGLFAVGMGFVYAIKNADELGVTPAGKAAEDFNISVVEAENLLGVLNQVGIDRLDTVEHDELLDDAYGNGEQGYRVSSNGLSNIIVYLTKDNTAFTIRYADNDLYKDGNTYYQITDFFMTIEEQTKYQLQSQKVIEGVLKSPASAKFASFSNWKFGKNKDEVIVQSYVDAQNGFGAIVRNEFQFIFKDGKITSFILDGIEQINY